MQFDDVGAYARGRFNRAHIGLDEKRHPHAGVLQRIDNTGEPGATAEDIETALGRALLAALRDDAAGIRQMAQGDGEHLVGRGHFEVKRPRQLVLEAGNIVIRDMPAILAQVRRDAVGAGFDGDIGGAQRIGMASAAGVADGGHVVDVDAEAQVGGVTHIGKTRKAWEEAAAYSAEAVVSFIRRLRHPRTTLRET